MIYMDHNATTPVEPRVLQRMLPYFSEKFGNAASRGHAYGWQAEEAVEAARAQVAKLMGAEPAEIVFTSGATEANNLALFGVMRARPGGHLITQATEHKAVLDVSMALAKEGFEVTVLPVDERGCVSPSSVAAAIREQTVLVSVMTANNEIGTLQPIAEIAAVCRERGVLLHTDAAQSAGLLPARVREQGIDLMSLSAHKLYGPKGVGALYVRRKGPRVSLVPQQLGGGQERGRRAGTLNVPGIVGFSAAAKLALAEGEDLARRLVTLAARLWSRLEPARHGISLNGQEIEHRLPGNLSLAIAGIEADALMMAMREVAFSSGAACTSTTLAPSHVLRAIGQDEARAHGTIRLGLGRDNTEEEVDQVAAQIKAGVASLRGLKNKL